MSRLLAKTVVAIVACFAVVLAFSGASRASTQRADLAVTGSVAGGETSTESFHLVVFVFTLKNEGPATTDGSADLIVTDVQGGTLLDTMCVLPNGFGINPDSPACETGPLQSHQSVHDTYVVQPSGSVAPVSMTACASNEGSNPDPVSSNNCKTLSVDIV